jgi:hypothetical protein
MNSEDHGSVAPLASPSVASPSLAKEPATPSEGVLRWWKWSEAKRLEDQAQKLRAEIREMDRIKALRDLKRLPPQQRAVLGAFVGEADSELCYSFSTISQWSGLGRAQVSRACKALRRLGFLSFHRGLFNEDGEVAGSGYALRDAGTDWWRTRETPTKDGSQTPATGDGEGFSKGEMPTALKTSSPHPITTVGTTGTETDR